MPNPMIAIEENLSAETARDLLGAPIADADKLVPVPVADWVLPSVAVWEATLIELAELALVGGEAPMRWVRLTPTGVVEAVTGSVVSTLVGPPRLSVPENVAAGASRGSMTVVTVPFIVTI